MADEHLVASRASIVIPVFNRVDLTRACLASLQAQRGDDELELIVVDNGSSDGSSQAVRNAWPDAVIIRNDTNQGFARACNQGAARATNDAVVFVNNDTEAHPGWLAPLLAALADDRVGLAAPRLLFPDGTLQHAGMYLIEDRRNGLALNGIHRYYRQAADLPVANKRCDCTIVTGAVLAVRGDVFAAVGGFDEGYWNGCEDVELCLAVGAAGWRVVYEPDSVLTHHESASGPERWTKVSDNLARLAKRWSGRVATDLVLMEDGSVMPTGRPVEEARRQTQAAAAVAGDSPVVAVDGSIFGLHSLAQVNRELSVRLSSDFGVRILPRSAEVPELTPADDARLVGVVRGASERPLPTPAVTIRQQWPPDWESPKDGSALVVCQPWEFGGLPDSWVGPLTDTVDEIWCYTSWVRDCYIRSGVPAERIVVVPIGVDATRFRPDGPRYPLRTTRARKLLFVGGAVYRKGIDVLIDAYRAAFSADDDVCLVIKTFGGSSFYRGISADALLREMASDHRGPAIEVIDADLSQDEMAALYRACDALVHPYRGEGFGMPIAEAMASGLAVIVTGDGAAMDFCDAECAYLIASKRQAVVPADLKLPPSSTGYWVAEPDRDDLARLLRHVAANPQEAASVGAVGRRRVVAQLNWDTIAATVHDRITNLRSRTPRRLDVDAEFVPGLPPYPLDEPAPFVVLADLAAARDARGPNDDNLRRVGTLVAGLAGCEGTTLVLHADAAMLADLEGVLATSDVDVLAVSPVLEGRMLARLYCAADVVAGLGNASVQRRAERCGRTVLDGADVGAIRRDLNNARLASRS